MKIIFGIGALILIGLVGFFMWSPSDIQTNTPATPTETKQDMSSNSTLDEKNTFTEGTYIVQADESVVYWAGKKPLIDGYVNSGSIGVTAGTIEVTDGSATGVFSIDMDTLSVSKTPTKPGSENTLEEHLKSERWFNVTVFPEASFRITEVTPHADSDTTFQYTINGELTMKGVTDTLSFPATIYTDATGTLRAKADFEFDRTRWSITSGSGSFFDNLADNVIDDMVALSFDLTAVKQ